MKTIRLAFLAAALACPVFAQDQQPKPAEAAAPTATTTNAVPATTASAPGGKNLRMNFRGAPLDMVLNYMSDAAGFIINVAPGTEVRGRVDVWSNQPLSKDEAVQLLNTVLHQNGYAAIRNGRTLSIVSRDVAKTKDVPVVSGKDPSEIEKSDEMVTQIIPVQYANAQQMVQNLSPLLPEYAANSLSANESGNSLILTATKTDVRRITEIVTALDTAISSVSDISVFGLKHADAKELATAVKELFTPPATNNNDRRNQFMQRMFGGGGPGGGDRGGGGGGGPTPQTQVQAQASRVIAVADERSNSLIVAAPSEAIPTIQKLVEEVDVPVDDITELRVFALKNSSPVEMADTLAQLFPDETQQNNQRRFGGGGFFGRGGAQQTTPSSRMQKAGKVIAVPDERTGSLIVSAAAVLMPQIENMIAQLDKSNAKRQKVYVYSIENADVQQVEQVVRDMFDRSNTQNRNQNMQNNALYNRSQQAIQQQNQNQQGFGQGGGQGRQIGQ